jgi:hypothetical protein
MNKDSNYLIEKTVTTKPDRSGPYASSGTTIELYTISYLKDKETAIRDFIKDNSRNGIVSEECRIIKADDVMADIEVTTTVYYN